MRICVLGFRLLYWKCCICSSLAGPRRPWGQKSRWKEGRVASLDRYSEAQWALSLSGSVSLSHSPLHPHFSCCLGKSTIPAALLNNVSVFKVPLLTTSLCQKQHACCVCLWKPPALGGMCTHSAVVSISLRLFLCHSLLCSTVCFTIV